jgi:hypothetical protein
MWTLDRMNEAEARTVLAAELAKYRAWSYSRLVELMSDRLDYPVTGPSGVMYQIDVQAFWDIPEEPNGNLRVAGAIDDGGPSAYTPICDSFIIAPNGTFVGE